MVRLTSMILWGLSASVSAAEAEESASMLQLLNKQELTAKQELTKRQGDSVTADETLLQLEKSLSEKDDDKDKYTPKSAGQTCYCPFTSGWRNSCCSEADNKGMNTGNFCGNYRQNFKCDTEEAPVCCNSQAGDAVCCKAGSSCSNGCLGAGATNGDATGVSLAVCACLDPPTKSKASDEYDEGMGYAMADLANAAGCSNGPKPQYLSGLYNHFTCPTCNVAGFQIEEKSVKVVIEHDKGFLLKDDDALFAFVARLKTLSSRDDGKPITVEDGDCVISIRGTKPIVNWRRNFQTSFEALDTGLVEDEALEHQEPHGQFNLDGSCEGCRVHKGYSFVHSYLKPGIERALKELGCGPTGYEADDGNGTITEAERKSVYVTGHSMGAGLATMFMYDLQMNKYKVGLSYVYESPRVGNMVFTQHFRFAFGRDVPMFRISSNKDLIVHTPLRNEGGFGGGYTHAGAEVYYGPSWKGEQPKEDSIYRYQVCGEDEPDDVRCGNRFNALDSLMTAASDHVAIPLIRDDGAFDIDQDWCKIVKQKCIKDDRWIYSDECDKPHD